MPTYANVPQAPKPTLKQRIAARLVKWLYSDEPMVWTSKGNLPQSTLRRVIVWEDEPNYTKMTERYYLGDEVVKESCDVLGRWGLGVKVEEGRVGG